MPALSILNTNNGVVVKECLTEHGRCFSRDGVPQRCEAFSILDIGGSTQIQKSPNSFQIVLFGCFVESSRTATGTVVYQGSTSD